MILKSSLGDVPEELIHHIQSLLPLKDAARTCTLSKSWLHAWLTIPNLKFPFKYISHVEYNNFLDHTLQRYRSNNIRIQSFHLGVAITNEETTSLAENWIRHVSNPKNCLKELSLDISVYMDLDRSVTLPLEIFSSENLKSITVTTNFGDVKFFNSLCSNNPLLIKCVSLRVLDLELVSITDKVLANLLSTCKLLENIRLFRCKDLKTVKFKNLAFLRELKILLLDPNLILEITGVPVLRMFDYRLSEFAALSMRMPFQMDSLGSVTQLIIGHLLMDDGFFNTIKSKLPLLESLTLRTDKLDVENCVISSVSLKRLNLEFYTSKQFVITVCAPKLISCICKCRGPDPLISFATITPVHFTVTSF